MATQVIKNLQVKISSIHLRYEDDVSTGPGLVLVLVLGLGSVFWSGPGLVLSLSDPQRPLSMGATLAELSLQTTDGNWKSCILNEAAKIIYKLGRLDCLCVYWNVNSPMFYKGSQDDIVALQDAGGQQLHVLVGLRVCVDELQLLQAALLQQHAATCCMAHAAHSCTPGVWKHSSSGKNGLKDLRGEKERF
ncbi:Vacuolar protein sorting-associated protein 13C [Liparis tanakae]|uniref:Vacuolar protein sorting-associated protein 13C n=1 Tax=Liparis tanakae TaxID=230148 RepID=A0A4Z2H476_9TELE|nr:Vacuolar protein sorting-associated protein 13C [Liparis tanakae]